MGTDSKGFHFPEPRELQSGLTRHIAGQISATTKTVLKACPPALRFDGMEVVVTADRSKWTFSAASTAADATDNLVMTPSDSPTAGRWLRADKAVQLKLAISFATADAAVLFTVPTGMRLWIERMFWEVTADFTGGTSSTIGASSSQSPYNTKGDLLGNSAGSAAAALTAGFRGGAAAGTDFAATNGLVVLTAASTIIHDRITDAFTAGTGFVHVLARQVA